MTELTVKLPDDLVQQIRAADLLDETALEKVFREALRHLIGAHRVLRDRSYRLPRAVRPTLISGVSSAHRQEFQ